MKTKFKGFSIGDLVETKVDRKDYSDHLVLKGTQGRVVAFPPYVLNRETYFVLVGFNNLNKKASEEPWENSPMQTWGSSRGAYDPTNLIKVKG